MWNLYVKNLKQYLKIIIRKFFLNDLMWIYLFTIYVDQLYDKGIEKLSIRQRSKVTAIFLAGEKKLYMHKRIEKKKQMLKLKIDKMGEN